MWPLERIYRSLGTGWVFLSFGLGGVVMSLAVLPLVLLIPGSAKARRRRVRGLIRWGFATVPWQIEKLGLGRFEIENEHLLAQSGGCLVLPVKHPTLIDVVVLISRLPEADCVVKQSAWRNPVLALMVSAAGYVSNAEAESVVATAAERLNTRNEPFIVFPEGTRTVPGEPLRFRRGAARIALASSAPIMPVVMECTPPTLNKGTPWYRVPDRVWTLKIRVLEARPLSAFAEVEGLEESLAVRRLTQGLKRFFERELGLL
ncbi:1-acyl-sn-glycerol-3-phosphate acyltransferase [Natronospira proteinivora]|uniref:1-acyl-sn-glycerol-3-phosphate acyltransferase n=1 Tax=Natronospira proteinivora TaxID=1807133 RepID=A0ABT1G8T5_9GAMM|nr:lysophospholipid acyltransferase family protein [Natronospira proteinivora]MCP1727730.1 1-acyl-sn-glycerol-3-phosphate acyltransferase [Natronospira proteinivora]